MTKVCPKCLVPGTLWQAFDVEGWRRIDEELQPTSSSISWEIDWDSLETSNNFGCSECAWEGFGNGLATLGIDGEPLPNIHRDQTNILEALDE